MRTKTLLIAAAALAAGIMASSAQTYSANIVGYTTSVYPGGNNYSLVVPTVGVTNGPAESLFPCLQPGDNLLIWTPGVGYAIYSWAGVGQNGAGGNWYDPNLNPLSSPTLHAGQAVFYQNAQGQPETNTFAGTVQLTNTVTLPGGNNYSLVGMTPPVGGLIDSTNFNLPLQAGDNVLIWTPGVGYAIYSWAGVGQNGAGGNWYDPNLNPLSSPSVLVGQGFFYQNSQTGAETWTNNITVQ